MRTSCDESLELARPGYVYMLQLVPPELIQEFATSAQAEMPDLLYQCETYLPLTNCVVGQVHLPHTPAEARQRLSDYEEKFMLDAPHRVFGVRTSEGPFERFSRRIETPQCPKASYSFSLTPVRPDQVDRRLRLLQGLASITDVTICGGIMRCKLNFGFTPDDMRRDLDYVHRLLRPTSETHLRPAERTPGTLVSG